MKLMELFKSKTQKLQELLENTFIIEVRVPDDESEFIEIILPLDEKFFAKLQKLLDKGAKVREEDLCAIKDNLEDFIQRLKSCPNDYSSDTYTPIKNTQELEAWIENHPRVLALKKVQILLEESLRKQRQ